MWGHTTNTPSHPDESSHSNNNNNNSNNLPHFHPMRIRRRVSARSRRLAYLSQPYLTKCLAVSLVLGFVGFHVRYIHSKQSSSSSLRSWRNIHAREQWVTPKSLPFVSQVMIDQTTSDDHPWTIQCIRFNMLYRVRLNLHSFFFLFLDFVSSLGSVIIIIITILQNDQGVASKARNLILVAGHSVTTSGHLEDADHDEADWFLLDYQTHRGLPQAILGHIRAGIDAARADPTSLLIFSGGETRPASGPDTEGASYFRVADAMNVWASNVRARTLAEEFATDSFQNL